MNPFDYPYLYWNRFYGTVDGKVCSWSYTGLGIQSPLTCELPFHPVNPHTSTPLYYPPPTTTTPIITIPTNPPVTTIPEPASVLLLAFGILAIFVALRFRQA